MHDPGDEHIEINMNFNDYQKQANSTALSTVADDSLESELYAVLGLTSEVGELAAKYKRLIRDKQGFSHDDMIKELGDILWYLSRIASINEIQMGEVATRNLEKLFDRKKRGVLGGSGDNR